MKFAIALITVVVTLVSVVRATELGESLLQQHFARADADADAEEGWNDINVGMLMRRDEPSGAESLEKRSDGRSSSRVLIKLDPSTGQLLLPRSWADASKFFTEDIPGFFKSHVKRASVHARRSMSVIITWYTGHDLLNPSCFPDSANWAPTDSSMAAAVTIAWPGKPGCGTFVKIRHRTDKNKSVVVRIVDSCGGCADETAHIDLTLGAFEKLYNRDVGLVEGLQAKIVRPPKGHRWSPSDIALYGPELHL